MTTTQGPPNNNYVIVKTDQMVNRYLNNSGGAIYKNGVTFIPGDLVLPNGVIYCSKILQPVNDSGATINSITSGSSISDTELSVDHIYNAGNKTNVTNGITAGNVSFQNPTGSVNNNIQDVGNLTMTGVLTVKGGLATNFIGNATLVAGTVTVANTNVTANSKIFLSRSTASGVIGMLSYTVTPATSFTITSVDPSGATLADTSIISYIIFNSN